MSRRPTECPACGHERIARRNPSQLVGSGGPSRRVPVEWSCQLCSYSWTPNPLPSEDHWEIA